MFWFAEFWERLFVATGSLEWKLRRRDDVFYQASLLNLFSAFICLVCRRFFGHKIRVKFFYMKPPYGT